MNWPNMQLWYGKKWPSLRVNAMLGTETLKVSVETKAAEGHKQPPSSPFVRLPALSASASRAVKTPILWTETTGNNISWNHLYLEANYIVSAPLWQVLLSGLCVLQHFLVIFICLFWFLVFCREEDCQSYKSCLLEVLLSLGNGAWGFPHTAQASTLTEVSLKKYNLHKVLYLKFSGPNEQDLKEERK